MESKDIRTLAQQIQLDCLIQDDFNIAPKFAKKADLLAKEGSVNSDNGFYVSFEHIGVSIRLEFGFRPLNDFPVPYNIKVVREGFGQYKIYEGCNLKGIEANSEDEVYTELAKIVSYIYKVLKQEADKEQEQLAKDEERYERNNSTF